MTTLQELAAESKRPLRLLLIRHGESARNAHGNELPEPTCEEEQEAYCAKGTPDHLVPLTDKGVEQARLTGLALYDKFGPLDVIYDSGYLRTKMTRQEIVAPYKECDLERLKLREDFRLREREAGYKFFMSKSQMERLMPWYKGYSEAVGPFLAQPPGGESHAQLCERVDPFIDLMFRQRAGLQVACVIHSGTKRGMRFKLEKWTHEKYEAEYAENGSSSNCGVTEYLFNPTTHRLELVSVNQTYY